MLENDQFQASNSVPANPAKAKMVEKKSSKTNLFDETNPEKAESPLDFLGQTGITTDLKDLVSLLIENRPEDPIAFMAEYFGSLVDTATPLTRAQQKLHLTHHSRPAFHSNVQSAFDILTQNKGPGTSHGLTGRMFNELLTLMCRDLSSAESEPLLRKLLCFNHEVIKFPIFSCAVRSTFLYQDFLQETECLYNELDLTERGKAARTLCEVALSHLKETVNSTTADPVSIIQAGAMLSTYRLNKAMAEALLKSRQKSQASMSVDEFIVNAVEIFLEKIPEFK